MNEQFSPATYTAMDKVSGLEKQNAPDFDVAEALEALASAYLKDAALNEASGALERAANIWLDLNEMQRTGASLLLATSSRRLAGNMNQARRNLEKGLKLELPQKIALGFVAESGEQDIEAGSFKSAVKHFDHVLGCLSQDDWETRVLILQRRAIAANLMGDTVQAGEDFLTASSILFNQGRIQESESTALAGAEILKDTAPQAAERIIQTIFKTAPKDGAALVHRAMIGANVALANNNIELAIDRFAQARQGALDAADPMAYWSAALSGAQAAETKGDLVNAYGRLASAWPTLAEVIGKGNAEKLVIPEIEKLMARIGKSKFFEVKTTYEANLKRKS